MVIFSHHCFSAFIVNLCTFSFVKGTCRDNVDNWIWYGFVCTVSWTEANCRNVGRSLKI